MKNVMMNVCAIRLWAPAVLLAGIALGAPFGCLEAQTPAAQASQSAIKALLDKARAQEARGRRDLAVQTWQLVLLTEPMNSEALANLARASRLAGDTKLADSYQQRLRALGPNPPSHTGTQLVGPAPDQKALARSAPVPVPSRTRAPSGPTEGQIARIRAADEAAAFQALNSNRIADAETRFKAILATDPENSKALAGMGYVRMQQGNFLGAISFLERATRGNADDKELLTALDTARFWFMMSEAQNALTTSDLAMAQKHYRAALELRPNHPEALEGLGRALLRAQQPEPAISLFERAVQAQPASVDGWRGLFMAQFQGGDPALALSTVKRIPTAVLTQLMHDPLFLQPLASAYGAVGRPTEAQATLQSALNQQFPTDVNGLKIDIEIQLAGMLASANHLDQAADMYQQALAEEPENLSAWQGLVRVQHASAHDAEALHTIDSMPPGVRARLETNALYLQTMASIYAALGQSREATRFLGRIEQNYAAQRSAPPPDLEIQNAWLLYNGMDDTGLYRQLMSLGDRQDLTAEQRRTVQTIWTNWAAQRARQSAAAGNSRQALAILNAAARAFPDNLEAIKSLAIAYTQAGQPHQAVLIYKAQNMASASASDYAAAVTSALADGDNKDAEAWLRFALKAYPADPQILILAARYEQARGDATRAIQYYRASLKAMPPVAPGSKPAADLGLSAPLAPLSLPSTDQPEGISILLAPGYSDSGPNGGASAQPHLPNGPSPLAPYDGTTRVAPSNITNPAGVRGGKPGDEASQVNIIPSPATPSAIQQRQAASSSPADPAPASRVEVYSPSVVPITQPPAPPVPDSGNRNGNPPTVAVQLGDNTPHPMQSQVDVTDVLPTARYAPSARANQAAASHEEVAAARAARIRRLQEDSNTATSGQSHPPSEDTITVATQNAEHTAPEIQVAQPTNPPGRQFGNVPDTGAQQYPQPSTPPRPSVQTPITRSRPVPRTSPAASEPPPPTAAPEQVIAQPAPAVSQPPPIPPTPPTPQPAPIATNPAPPPTGSLQPPPPIAPVNPLVPSTDAELTARNLPPLGGYFPAQVPIPMTQRQQAESEIASLEGSYSGWLGGAGIGRYRDGTAGIDRLYDVESPAEASAVIARSVRLTVVALPVFLNSGLLNNSGFATGSVPYLGTLAANATNPPAQQFSNGIGGEIQLTTRNIGLAAGYTPYEFPVRNFTGRVRWSTLNGHLSVNGERQPVKDTQLSYAGLHNPGASFPVLQGPIWGGVLSTSGGLRVEFPSKTSTFFVSGEGGILTGQHVRDNTRFSGTTGANFRLGNWPAHGSLTLGGSLSGMHYTYNQSGLSYGQGGYFSPSSYFLASVPISFNGHYKANFHYVIAGSLGVQTFEQDEAPFFPLDPSLQTNFIPSNGASCSASQSPSYNCGEYPLTDTTSFTYAFNSEASYRFGEHWYGGGFVFANNARNYDTVSAGFFLRFAFRAQHSPEGYPAGLFSVDGFRSLQFP